MYFEVGKIVSLRIQNFIVGLEILFHCAKPYKISPVRKISEKKELTTRHVNTAQTKEAYVEVIEAAL